MEAMFSPPSDLGAYDLRIGTVGYEYPEWEGVLYSHGTDKEAYLRLYCERFSTLELDFTFHTMPKAAQMRDILARALGSSAGQAQFQNQLIQKLPVQEPSGRAPTDFSVIAHSSLTHRIDPFTWSSSLRTFLKGIEPLAEADRLCAVLLVFPFSFRYREEERRYLDKLLKALETYPLAAYSLAVEFQNSEWLTLRVIEELKNRNVALCALDMPRMEGRPPISDIVTSDLAYIRFLGRAAPGVLTDSSNSSSIEEGARNTEEGLWCPDLYRYKSEELALWIPRILSMSAQASKMRIFFGNRRKGNAPLDACAFTKLLRAAGL
ncbi:MAG TPA: DUF72 domain-containing protein [Rectinema sp.]|nr:DUF72 domain-containing protein [Rectinema sp.]